MALGWRAALLLCSAWCACVHTATATSVITTVASVGTPSGAVVNGSTAVLIADEGTSSVYALPMPMSGGVLTRVAGTGTSGFSGDGGPATSAQLWNPAGIALSQTGVLLIADSGNSRVRAVAADTGVITTLAGSGVVGFSGDGGPATSAALYYVQGVATDGDGSVLLADWGNHRIRSVVDGVISTVAGTGVPGYGGDGGPATLASLWYPQDVAWSAATATWYIADYGNARIRAVLAGIITTLAGTGVAGIGGQGGPSTAAQVGTAYGLSVASNGDVFIADWSNARIARVSGGVLTSAAGVGGLPGDSGDGGPATAALLDYPRAVAVSVSGDAYVCDTGNSRVRLVTDAAASVGVSVGDGDGVWI